MPSKKKTRKQKILADQRREQPAIDTFSYSIDDSVSSQSNARKPQLAPANSTNSSSTVSIDTQHYQFLKSDLKRTAALTFAIIFLQVILFFFLQQR